MDDVQRLVKELGEAVNEEGWGMAVVILDIEGHQSSASLLTLNTSEATVCAGLLLSAILRQGEPVCPHCLNNYRRVEKALQTMKTHPDSPEGHSAVH